jgi:hypothetical protein
MRGQGGQGAFLIWVKGERGKGKGVFNLGQRFLGKGKMLKYFHFYKTDFK